MLVDGAVRNAQLLRNQCASPPCLMPRIRSHPHQGSLPPSSPRRSLRYPSVESNPGAGPNPGPIWSSTDSSFHHPDSSSPRAAAYLEGRITYNKFPCTRGFKPHHQPPPCNPPGFATHPATSRGFYFIPVYPRVYPRRADQPMPIAVKQRAFNEFFSRDSTAIVLLADKLQRIISEMKARDASPLITTVDWLRR